MKAPWRLSGYIDAEVQAPRTADRDAVIQQALARYDGRLPPVKRTRVTNLIGGQWGVRFYL